MTGHEDAKLWKAIDPLDAMAGATQEEDRRHLIARRALVNQITSDAVQWQRFCLVVEPHSSNWNDALRAAHYYVEHILDLDAPWLGKDLAIIYLFGDQLRAMSEDEQNRLWLMGWEEYDPAAPSLAGLPEDWAAGLTTQQAEERLRDFHDQAKAALTLPTKPRGTLRRDLDAATTDRVSWWYRHKILEHSHRKIAKDAGRANRPVDIRKGISQAERWLFDPALVHFRKFEHK